MNYLILQTFEMSVCIILFFTLYFLLMRKDTHFGLNRVYLLTAATASIIIPLLNIKINSFEAAEIITGNFAVVNVFSGAATTSGEELTAMSFLTLIYIIGAGLFFVKLIYNIAQIYRIKSRSTKIIRGNVTLILTEGNNSTFSFFSNIFVPRELWSESDNNITLHELNHIRYKHSWDVIFFELLHVLLWYNPLMILIKRELKIIHEYQADNAVIQKGASVSDYMTTILDCSFGKTYSAIINSFNYLDIKRRLFMLTKNKSSKLSAVKLFAVIPLVLGMFLAFSCDAKNEAPQEQPAQTVEQATEQITPEPEIPEVMPEFQGEMVKFLQENINYPETAKKEGIEGKVIVGFWVEADGSVSGEYVVNSVSKELDAEALRVTKLLDKKFKPGMSAGQAVRAKMLLPFMFKLSDGDKK